MSKSASSRQNLKGKVAGFFVLYETAKFNHIHKKIELQKCKCVF